jgi:hypothetical protein
MLLKRKITSLAICLVLLHLFSMAQNKKKDQGPNNDNSEAGIFYNTVPDHLYDIILSRPENHSISISILSNDDLVGSIQYGLNPGKLNNNTADINFKKGHVQVIKIDNLLPGNKYWYKFKYRYGEKELLSKMNYFQLQRPLNNPFTFTVQADSHLDENTNPEMYLKTLLNMAEDSADFLIDLGDTWMTDKYRNDYKESLKQYIAQRYYFGTVCKSSALFLTLGNHDGETGQQLKKKNGDNMTNWATLTRKNYYTNPEPGDFYIGNTEMENGIGYPENYYAWEWGNALFIVLDPFRYSAGNKDPWQRTLGEQQYNWLKKTLQQSKAGFKFVFIHNLVGGVDLKGKGRGGIEAASYYEWGGKDSSGVNTFSSHRPGWEKPIHDLLINNGVNIVFHGHDHFFAKQDLGGMVYQLVPQPGAIRYGNTNNAAEYGYVNGKIMNGPGYMRVSIEEKKATIEFVQSSIDTKHKNKEVLYTYTIEAK